MFIRRCFGGELSFLREYHLRRARRLSWVYNREHASFMRRSKRGKIGVRGAYRPNWVAGGGEHRFHTCSTHPRTVNLAWTHLHTHKWQNHLYLKTWHSAIIFLAWHTHIVDRICQAFELNRFWIDVIYKRGFVVIVIVIIIIIIVIFIIILLWVFSCRKQPIWGGSEDWKKMKEDCLL